MIIYVDQLAAMRSFKDPLQVFFHSDGLQLGAQSQDATML